MNLQIAFDSVDFVLNNGYERFAAEIMPAEWKEAGGVKPFFEQLKSELEEELGDNAEQYEDHVVLTDFMQCHVDRELYAGFVSQVKERKNEIYQSEGADLEYLASMSSVIDNKIYDLLEFLDFSEREYSCVAFARLQQERDMARDRQQKLQDAGLMPVADVPHVEKSGAKPGVLKWNASDVDLLELCVALMESDSVRRMDGAELTRKELVEAFVQFLGMNAIKDPDKKLNQAKARKKENTGFLKRLSACFDSWRERCR